jgi:hypothetical protein
MRTSVVVEVLPLTEFLVENLRVIDQDSIQELVEFLCVDAV